MPISSSSESSLNLGLASLHFSVSTIASGSLLHQSLFDQLLEMINAMLAPACTLVWVDHEGAAFIAPRVQPFLNPLDETLVFHARNSLDPADMFRLLGRGRF